tara:strand:- start:665 stop:2053 length:1389 start_codon:yes stop_codon:yes gene_type:complete
MSNKLFFYLIISLTALKVFSSYFTSLSIYGDEAQYWLWSKSLDLGYFSKPPLLAWFLSAHTGLFGDSFLSLKLFPIFVYLFISYSVYNLCRKLSLSQKDSFFCSISFYIIPAASLSSFLVSTDLLLLLFWSLSMKALLELTTNNSTKNYFFLGVFLGLSFLAKYAAVYFFLSLVLLIFADRKSRKKIFGNFFGLFIFSLSFVILLLPNIIWNFNNSWVTFAHTSSNANLKNINLNVYEPLKFFVSQLLMVGPVLSLSFVFMIRSFKLTFENKFLLIFSLPIIFIVLVEGFLVRANANWAAPALISIFILFFKIVLDANSKLLKINFVFNYFVAVFLFLSILLSSQNIIFDRIRGVDNFVYEISSIIGEKDLVVSDRIIFSSASYYLKNKGNKIYMPFRQGSLISNHFQIISPLKPNREKGFFFIGELEDIAYLDQKKNSKLVKEFFVSFSKNNLRLYEINFK